MGFYFVIKYIHTCPYRRQVLPKFRFTSARLSNDTDPVNICASRNVEKQVVTLGIVCLPLDVIVTTRTELCSLRQEFNKQAVFKKEK